MFGEAFWDAVFRWTKDLCLKDSDGDGQTNGFELGDPYCCWKVGDSPTFVTDLSHPGLQNSVSSRKDNSRRLHGDHVHGEVDKG